MTAPTRIEDRLRRALAAEAAALEVGTTPAFAAPPAPRRRPVLLVAALAAVTVLSLAVVARDDGRRRLQVTAPPGRLYLAPTDAKGFRLTDAATDPDLGELGGDPISKSFFAKPSQDGTTVTATVAVFVFATDPQVPRERAETLLVEGEYIDVVRGPDDNAVLMWEEGDGSAVHVATSGLADVELVALAASLRPGPAASVAPALPTGVLALPADVRIPDDDAPLSTQHWVSDNGDSFDLIVAEDPALTPAALVWSYPQSRATTVRGHEGRVFDGELRRLGWLERPGALVTLDSSSLTIDQMRGIAENLRALDAAEWKALTATAQPEQMMRKRGRSEIVAKAERAGKAWEALAYELEVGADS